MHLSSNLHARHRHFASLARNQERNRIGGWVCIQRSVERGSAHLHLLHFISRLHVDHIHAWQRAQQKCVQRYRKTRAGCELLLHKRAAEELSSGCDGWEINNKKKEAATPGSSARTPHLLQVRARHDSCVTFEAALTFLRVENRRDYADGGLFTRGARGEDLSDFVLRRYVSQRAYWRRGSTILARPFYKKLMWGPSLTGGIPTDNPLSQLAAPQAAEGTATRESSHLNNLLPRLSCRVPACANLTGNFFFPSPPPLVRLRWI